MTRHIHIFLSKRKKVVDCGRCQGACGCNKRRDQWGVPVQNLAEVQQALAVLREQKERHHREHAVVLDRDLRQVGDVAIGDGFSVTEHPNVRQSGRGGIFLHNQPSSNPLSGDDLNAIDDSVYHTVIALTNDEGIYCATQTEDSSRCRLQEVFHDSFKKGLEGCGDRDRYRYLTMLGRHVVLDEMDRAGLLRYDYQLGSELKRYFDEGSPVIAKMRDQVRRAIREHL